MQAAVRGKANMLAARTRSGWARGCALGRWHCLAAAVAVLGLLAYCYKTAQCMPTIAYAQGWLAFMLAFAQQVGLGSRALGGVKFSLNLSSALVQVPVQSTSGPGVRS